MWDLLFEELDTWHSKGLIATFWFRDDDASKDTKKLRQLINCLDGAPIALATIPGILERSLIDYAKQNESITIIQHGWKHQSHVSNGKAFSEYPSSRLSSDVLQEFSIGRNILEEAFGDQYKPVFVPPWHSIDTNFLRLLMQAGIYNISLRGTPKVKMIDRINIRNIHTGLVKWTNPPSFDSPNVYLNDIISHLKMRRNNVEFLNEVTGIATHHLDQTDDSLIFISQLISIIRHHPTCKVLSANEVFRFEFFNESQKPIKFPHFIISYNRHEYTKKLIATLMNKFGQDQIIIHDNGSDDPATLLFLEEMENFGIQVFRYEKINAPDELNKVDITIQKFFENRTKTNYVVTDNDIDIEDVDCTFYSVLNELLLSHDNVDVVGPMLKINDVPFVYPLYNHVMNLHINQFWHKMPVIKKSSTYGEVAFQFATIDTTFGLHKAGTSFRRLKRGLRLYSPYEARHLDWYVNTYRELGKNESYATNSCNLTSHWNNREWLEKNKLTPLKHSEYLCVRNPEPRQVEIYLQQVSDFSKNN